MRNVVWIQCSFLFVVCFALVSCNRYMPASDLYGNYTADYAEATEDLQLYPDKTFRQRVILRTSGRVDVAAGNWRYNSKSGYVSFSSNFMVVLDGYHQLDKRYFDPSPGEVTQPVTKRFGRISIGSSEGIVYHKRKPSGGR